MAKTPSTQSEVDLPTSNKNANIVLPKLRRGDVSACATAMKMLLQGYGYSVTDLSTYVDNQTLAQIQRFQKVNHIPVNDCCDELTWKCLLGTS